MERARAFDLVWNALGVLESALSVCVLFFLSGISGLIHQVVWVREFGSVFGNTVYSASTVTAVFMCGLGRRGSGGHLAISIHLCETSERVGRISRRFRRPERGESHPVGFEFAPDLTEFGL